MELDTSNPANPEAQTDHPPKHGGWITFPFIIATSACLLLGNVGWVINLTVYMIEEFNVKRIDAAQVFNMVNGSINLSPLIGAIIADSFLGCFSVIWISSFLSLLGTILLTLTSAISSLRPQTCETGSTTCPTPSKFQLAILYAGLALSSFGVGGMRYTLTTMGANQFATTKQQSIYFNWYFFSSYASAITASTAIVYVEDNVSWALGFGLCAGATALGLVIFLLGSRFYRHVKPEGSPFTSLVQVFVASIRKRKVQISLKNEDYYRGHVNGIQEEVAATPTRSFRYDF
ncbi:hypothetical protein Vadar_021578 [Vaccinium darrowii]|uniref:Uncharacterized protein n=1 Tax=Vaccinium darrowii TaxID=229202 RepID=A0ACB7XBL5_9ERIC|nr:hypothetical protein Vadar_021578 [Vaccinium darrowii]